MLTPHTIQYKLHITALQDTIWPDMHIMDTHTFF